MAATFVFLGYSFLRPASSDKDNSGLYPVREGGFVGYIDKTGAFRIDPRFDEGREFSEGLAAVKVDDCWGYVDASGKIAIPPQFAYAEEFAEERANVLVGQGGNYGFVDPSGKVVIDPKLYSDREAFRYSHFAGNRAKFRLNENYGYVDKTGEIVISPQFPGAGTFSEGLAWVSVGPNKRGYIDSAGRIVIAPQFEDARDFADGLAPVKANGKWGYINPHGQMVIAAQFEDALGFAEGLASVKADGVWGYVDADGVVVIPPKFDGAGKFSTGLAVVAIGDREGYIDRKGTFAIGQVFDVAQQFRGALAAVQQGGDDCYIDRSGSVIWRRSAEAAFNEERAIVNLKWLAESRSRWLKEAASQHPSTSPEVPPLRYFAAYAKHQAEFRNNLIIMHGYRFSEGRTDPSGKVFEYRAELMDDATGAYSFNITDDYKIRSARGSRAPDYQSVQPVQ